VDSESEVRIVSPAITFCGRAAEDIRQGET
jgi:hypothetical protein